MLKNEIYKEAANIAVIGATGYTGVELIRLLLSHPKFRIASLTADSRAGGDITDIFQHLNTYDLPKLVKVEDVNYNNIDAVFCCVPHGESQSIINNIPENVNINVVKAYLESILLNIFTNAIKYKAPKRYPKITINCEHVKGFTILSVTDNGLGIDLEKHGHKLFGMYKTFHGNRDARGIGLFITKNQIEAMKGKIEAESELDKGTTFKIYFNENY